MKKPPNIGGFFLSSNLSQTMSELKFSFIQERVGFAILKVCETHDAAVETIISARFTQKDPPLQENSPESS